MKEELNEVVNYWIEKSKESLNSAIDELKAGCLSFSVNRIYYSCFYIVSALLLKKGFRFKKHSGVRACFHKNFVKTGVLEKDFGLFYDEVFESRQRGDYIEMVSFQESQVKTWIEKADNFIKTIERIIRQP